LKASIEITKNGRIEDMGLGMLAVATNQIDGILWSVRGNAVE
jgi:hypothetical protein